MSLADLLPEMQVLPREEKGRLLRLLTDELETDELLSMLKSVPEWPIYTPEFAPEAAFQLARLLEEQETSDSSIPPDRKLNASPKGRTPPPPR